MRPLAAHRRPTLFAALLFAFVVAACSPGTAEVSSPSTAPSAAAVVSPAATPRPTAKPTPTPSPKPTPSPTPTAEPTAAPTPKVADAARGLKIGKPYTFTLLDPALEASFRQQMEQAVQFLPGLQVGGRDVVQNQALVGYVFAIAFPKGVLTTSTYKVFIDGIATGAGQTVNTVTISGVKVSVTKDKTIAFYRYGGTVLMITTAEPSTINAVTKALIAGNK